MRWNKKIRQTHRTESSKMVQKLLAPIILGIVVGGAVIAIIVIVVLGTTGSSDNRKFPEGFKFGVATASYQIEGAWNADGKGANIWDHICHINPSFVDNQDNGDVACDSYNLYERDVEMLKELGVDFYRFSLSWSRILPTGRADQINPAGVRYYRNLISLLLENGIEPMVTIYHWDLPQDLQDIGGWPNPDLADIFVDYARVVFEEFGDLVKTWITFNEPLQTCIQGYGSGGMAPGLANSGTDDYLCAHTVIRAHGKAWHLYDSEFRSNQKGRISITTDTAWFEPADPNKPGDVEAAERALHFTFGWYANPIYRRNYPQVMIDAVGNRSALAGLQTSRLPTFTEDELNYISGTFDFMGFNAYTSNLVEPIEQEIPATAVNFWADLRVRTYQLDSWDPSASSWLKRTPWGLRKALNWFKTTYNNPEIIITENGWSDLGELNDEGRILYYKTYLDSLLSAILEDGVRVTGYTAWSLMDNLEWARGYREKFGLYHVNFSDPQRPRRPKASAKFYSEVIRKRSLE